MGNWKYDLGECGEELRAAIEVSEDIQDLQIVCEKFKECLIYLKKSLKEEDKCHIESIDDLIETIDDLYPDESDDYESKERLIDFHLDDFYDLCDLLRAWVAL